MHIRYKHRNNGFTIVELLIAIVVIGILAAITIVAYNGIQARARDSERTSEMASVEKALALYFVDNSGYPNCSGTLFVTGTTPAGCSLSNLAPALVPKYMNAIPTDPKNSGLDVYRYAIGYKKQSDNTYIEDVNSNSYITGMRLETRTGNLNTGWTSPNYYNYLGGSSN